MIRGGRDEGDSLVFIPHSNYILDHAYGYHHITMIPENGESITFRSNAVSCPA